MPAAVLLAGLGLDRHRQESRFARLFDFFEAGLPGERKLVSAKSAKGAKLWELVSPPGGS